MLKLSTEMDDIRDDTSRKLSGEEGRALWANFSKFAGYEDLKDLYKRCLPAVAQCEDKLQT